VVAGDAGARDDLEDGAGVSPPDLLDRLLRAGLAGAELVAHARIGAHHILKTRFRGAVTYVVQARWVEDATGRWRIRDLEVVGAEPGR
jgi:hypothetical protein